MEKERTNINKKNMDINDIDIEIRISTWLGSSWATNVHIEQTSKGINIMSSNGAAYCHVYMFDKQKELFIESLNVEPLFRHNGIAGSLMVMFLEMCKFCDCPGFLFVEKGSWMQSWYERLGFKYH